MIATKNPVNDASREGFDLRSMPRMHQLLTCTQRGQPPFLAVSIDTVYFRHWRGFRIACAFPSLRCNPSEQVDETEDLPTGPEHEPSEPTTDHLKHGQSLRGRSLVSIDGAAKVRLGMYGSVLFARYPAAEKLEVSEDGKTSSPMELDTLIRADPSKVERAMKIRSKLATEASGGKHANKNVLAWTPWVRRYNRQVDMARQHSGEVDMTIDDNGCLVSFPFLVMNCFHR